MRALLILLLICALTAPLGACGKKGDLEPPPGKKSEYLRQYPQ